MQTVAQAEQTAAAQQRPRRAGGVPFKPGQSGNPAGRAKGSQNNVTRTIKEAIELACKPGQCHPQGLAGWLVERATGGVEDRKIFAGMVAKVIPAQLQANIQGGITVHLPWLQTRTVGRGQGTPTAQFEAVDAQVIELTRESDGDLRVHDPKPALEAAADRLADVPDPPPPVERQVGGGQ